MFGLNIREKILGSFILVIVLFSFAMVLFAKTVIYNKLRQKLLNKGLVITKKIANDCVNPIITESYFKITMQFKDMMKSERDMVYAYVLNNEGAVLAHTFQKSVPKELKSAHPFDSQESFSFKKILTERGYIQDIAVPILEGKIGVLHLGFSKDAIHKDVNEIVKAIVVFSFISLLCGIIISVFLSRNLTRSLRLLAKNVELFGRGELPAMIDINSNDEVGELANVFNLMFLKRKQTEAEREDLIKDLQKALDKVKLLSGFLPICSSCKKIRDDKGYWSQVENYISTHSEVEFSHSICPECMKREYPELFDENGDLRNIHV